MKSHSISAILGIFSLAVLATPVIGQEPSTATPPPPKPAQQMLTKSLGTTAKQHKPTLVIFHATWCGWCHRLDDLMAQPPIKKIFDKNFVVLHLDVMENGEKVAQYENPGGKDLMTKLGGEKSGLPYYAWLDEKGSKLADSNAMPKDANIGYPGSAQEIDTFMALIKKTAPHLTAADETTLHDALVKNMPKQ